MIQVLTTCLAYGLAAIAGTIITVFAVEFMFMLLDDLYRRLAR